MLRFFLSFLSSAAVASAQPLSFDTNPLGQADRPLLLRTYAPDPGLDPAVFANHGQASPSPVYSPKDGRDHPEKGDYELLKVIPGAIAVNHGLALSYVFDTTECRVLYAWQGGFLDMFPYWGDATMGSRRSFDYAPRLMGHLFYLARPEERPKPRFLGYDLSAQGVPTFRYRLGETAYEETILPNEKALSFKRIVRTAGEEKEEIVSGEVLSRHQGFDRTIKIDEPNEDAGEQVFLAYGCVACHSTDGSDGHGPTLKDLHGSMREIEGGEPVLADDNYLRESIFAPNAKTAKGFPPNYMPPFQLPEKELASVILFIKSAREVAPE
ncbi:c-type cytochrome [Roseibacillus ishigakijimensis]|uniref:Cytochrome c n=1 Tax=Roseibacillus ishigakijimensis TaxID=454146 RepID=A0A934RNY8_9BACT|nr:cytochrome c [Roseibacillus ishigakijimensis]MBK1832886.1 cytochrome c [Roseibacillus ishigakijimensis]